MASVVTPSTAIEARTESGVRAKPEAAIEQLISMDSTVDEEPIDITDQELLTRDWTPGEGERSLNGILNARNHVITGESFRFLDYLPSNREGIEVESGRVKHLPPYGAAPIPHERGYPLTRQLQILQEVWDHFHLNHLRAPGITPIIAGGWVEHVVWNGIAHSMEEKSRRRLHEYFSEYAGERDIDVFLCFPEERAEEAFTLMAEYMTFIAQILRCHESLISIGNSGMSFASFLSWDSSEHGPDSRTRKIQIVPVRGKTPSDVLNSTDLDCCCSYYTGGHHPPLRRDSRTKETSRSGTIMILPRGLRSWETRVNVFRPSRIFGTYEARVVKYYARGYDLVFPSVYNSLLTQGLLANPDGKDPLIGVVSRGGLVDLFDANCGCGSLFGGDAPRVPHKEEEEDEYYSVGTSPLLHMPFHYVLSTMIYSIHGGHTPPFTYFPMDLVVKAIGEVEAARELRDYLLHGTYSDRVLSIIVEKPKILKKSYEKRWRFGESVEVLASMEKNIEATQLALVASASKLIKEMTLKPTAPNLHRLILDGTPVIVHTKNSLRPSQIEDWFCTKGPSKFPIPELHAV